MILVKGELNQAAQVLMIKNHFSQTMEEHWTFRSSSYFTQLSLLVKQELDGGSSPFISIIEHNDFNLSVVGGQSDIQWVGHFPGIWLTWVQSLASKMVP